MASSPGDHFIEGRRAAGLQEPKMWAVYVLRLNCDREGNPKYYVGMTNNLWNRLHNHARGNDLSSKWVLKWGYVKVVEAVYCGNEDNAKMTESAYTLDLKQSLVGTMLDGVMTSTPTVLSARNHRGGILEQRAEKARGATARVQEVPREMIE